KRRAIPYSKVGIFAALDRAHAVVHADDPRRIDSDHLQRFFLRGAAVVDDLGSLLVQAAHYIVGIALQRHPYAFAKIDRRVPRNAVPTFILEAPPIGPGGN